MGRPVPFESSITFRLTAVLTWASGRSALGIATIRGRRSRWQAHRRTVAHDRYQTFLTHNCAAHQGVRLHACTKRLGQQTASLKTFRSRRIFEKKIRTFEAENRPERLRTRYWRTISGKHLPDYRNLKRNLALPPRNRMLTKFCVIFFRPNGDHILSAVTAELGFTTPQEKNTI
jgi:hypothetical protein